MYDPNMGYWVEETENGPQEVQIPHEEVNARLEEMKSQGRTVRPMQYFKFRGEKGEKMEVPQSELEDFYQSAMESGKRFAPVFTMVDPKTGEKREFAKWGKNEQGSDYQANIFIGADRRDLAEARANGWKMEGVQDPGAKEIVDHFWKAENWTDPTGEDGALVWNAKNIAKGVAATTVAAATGVAKAIPNAVLNIGAAGASLVEADDVADKLRQGRDWVDQMLDHSVLTERILSGGEWDAKALKDFGLGSAESLGSLWGLGGAVKTVAKGLKLASGVEAAMEHASAGQAATINKMAGGAALAAIMGAEAYEGAMADPRIRDAGPKGKFVAAANLLTAAATSRLFGKIVGLGVNEQLAQGIAKESFADALKVTGMEMLEFAGINELNAVTDEGARLLTGLSDRDIGRITKRFGTEAVEGGKTVFLMRAGRYGRLGAGKAMEGMNTAAERIAHHAAERRGVYFHEATKGFGNIEGRMEEIRRTNGGMTTEELVQEGMKIWEKEGDAEKPVVVAVTESGVGVLDDGGMVRNDNEGKKEVVTPNGVVVDEAGGVKTVAPGRCGNVGEEYGVRVEEGRTADKPGAEIPSFGRQTVENACILLNEIEQGACKGEVVDIDAIKDILPSWKGEGGSGAETPTAESLPNAPLIVLEGEDGSLRLVNGRGRLAYAKEQGARQVRAVKLREADGWTPELAYCVDVVENLRSGAPIGGDAAVAAIEKLGLGYAEAEEMGLLGAKGGTVARAAMVVEYGSQHLIDAVKGQIIPLETAESIVDSTVGDRLGVKSEEWNALTEELTGRLSLATRDEARDVMFELDRVIQGPGMDMADPASRKAAVDAAVDAALERRRKERAERNGTTVDEEAAIGSTPVETADGRLTTVRGLEREKEERQTTEKPQEKEPGTAEEGRRDATVGTELKPKEDGAFGCAAFPGARMSMQTVERADGTRGEAVVIEGLTAEEMLKPERREEATAFLQRAAKAAQEAGKELCIPDEAAREAAMRLLEDRAVEETREEMARAEEQRRTDEVAASGQAELANKVFGGTATVRVGTEQERAEVEKWVDGEKRYLRDGEGVFGYWDRAKKECVLFRGADETTLAHEMGWHAAYQWAEENNPALFRKMREWAASCPEELREAIREAYGEDGPLTEDVLLDEFGAGRFEREHADTLKRALQKPEAKHWWTKLMRMVADAWKGALRRMGGDRINLKNIERMTPEEAVRFLAEQMAKGKKLGEFGAEGETGKRFARKLIDGKETAVAIGYPLPIREARNPEKVMELMSGLVGKSAAQLGEMKLTRITEKSVEHLVNSKEARFTKTGSARKDKKETRTRIAGISVTQDIIATSGLGTKRPADHLNKEWKKDATFYEAETRFAIETEDGNMTVFPCRLVVCERKGERIVYDIVEIGQGIPTTSRAPKGSSLAGRQEDYNSSPQRDYNSMGVSPDAQSLAKQNPPVNPDVRYSRRGNGSAKDDLLPAREAMAHIWENGVRVVKEGAPGYGEQSEAGRAAGAEAMNADVAARRGQDWSVSMSEMLELVRAVTGNPAYPRVMKAMKERPWLGQVTKKGEVQIDAELFGIVDRTDRDVIKNDLKQMGMFRNEDPAWSMRHSKAQNENEREMSEFQLMTRLKTLADQRIAGTAGGGNRTALNVMAHEIGHIACDLPVRPNDPALLKGLHTLGDGLIKEFQKADVKKINLNQRFPGLNAEAAGIKMEALEFVRWWRGVGDVNAGPGKGFEDYFRRNDRELWAEVFGAFLAAPHELETRAPAVFREIKDAIGRSDVLMDAFRTIRANRGLGGAAEAVMRRIEKEWDYREQVALKNLAAELDKPIGGAWHNLKGAFYLNLGSNESPATMLVTEGVQARIKELKAMRRRGALSESQYRAMVKDARRVLDDFRIGILEKQRGGGAGRLYAEEFLNKTLEGVKGAGIEIADFRRYLKAQRVIEVQGRAMDAGMSPREARQVLDALKTKLGTEGWRRMEGAAKMFQALREKHILDDAHVREMFGDALIGYWRQNVHYVTTRRRANAEEVEAYAKARAAWKAAHPHETDVLADMEAIFAVCRHRNYGESGDVFTHRLEGSFKMSEDPLSATLANDLNILAAARRNHYVCELAKAAKELKLEGFMEVADAGMHIPSGSNRYGEVAFLKDGRRMRLVMPKMVAEGFRRGAAADIHALVKMNRMLSAILTQYNPRFAWRNMFRNRETNNINIPWMREGAAVTAAGLAGFRPHARLAEMLIERVMVHLPDKAARNAVMNVFWGPHTNMYYAAQATRYAKWMENPKALLKRARKADDLAAQGEYAKAQAIVDDIETFKELVKRPVFAGAWRQALGQTDRTDLDAVFDSLGMKAQPEGGLKNVGKIAKRAKNLRDIVKRYNNFEEARIKFMAMLAAEHDNMIRRAKGKEERSRAQIDYTVATMSGSPRYEQRGRWMNYIEMMCGPFMNVGMKGAWRTVEAMKMDPKAWWSKAALRYSQHVMSKAVFGGGLVGVACGLLRKLFEDDEEMQGRIDGFENFCRRQTAALANISSHRLRNYDIIPIATFGKYTTFALNLPRGDEDRLLMPLVDMTVKALLGSDAAKARGFTDPIDTEMDWSDVIGATFANSGVVPDVTRRGILLNVVMDAAGPWLFDVNPYNTFTQRNVYAKEDFDTRFVDPVNFLEKQGKQLWNDLGGQVLLPMPTWDEDEASYAGAPESAWSTEKLDKTLGEENDGEEEGDGNGPVHWAAGSIFKLLHTVPFLSSMASGLMTLQSGGNVRIARRLAAMDKERQATLDRVATDIVDLVAKNGTEYDYEADLDEAAEKYGLEEEDRAIVQTVVMRKAKKLAGEGKMLDKPILQVMKKAKANPAWYRNVRKTLIGYGWTDLEED